MHGKGLGLPYPGPAIRVFCVVGEELLVGGAIDGLAERGGAVDVLDVGCVLGVGGRGGTLARRTHRHRTAGGRGNTEDRDLNRQGAGQGGLNTWTGETDGGERDGHIKRRGSMAEPNIQTGDVNTSWTRA